MPAQTSDRIASGSKDRMPLESVDLWSSWRRVNTCLDKGSHCVNKKVPAQMSRHAFL
jgi:hypothetical protein